jgi:hypothetical protein
VVPVAVTFCMWKIGRVHAIGIVVIVAVSLWIVVKTAWPICRVRLTESEIHISFLLPFMRGGSFRIDEIEWYTEVAKHIAGRRVVFGGVLKPKDHKPIFILPAGIRDFDLLNPTLLQMFPKPTQSDNRTRANA